MNARQSLLNRALMLGSAVLIMAAAVAIFNHQAQAKSSERGFLGVYLGSGMDEDFRESLDFKGSGGAFIDGVVEDGPADEAGLEDGDVIVSFDGVAVEDESHLRGLIRKTKPGDEVAVTVFRDGKEKDFSVTIGESSDVKVFSWSDKDFMGKPHKFIKCKIKSKSCRDPDRGWMGVEIRNLSEQLGEYFEVKDGKGILITSVLEDSPAEKAGLKAGDVLVKADDEGLEKCKDLHKFLREKDAGDEVTFSVVRKGKTKKLKITLAEVPEEYCSGSSCKCCIRGPGGIRHGGLKALESLKALECFEELKDLEIILPDLEGLKDIHIELDEPLEELKEQMEELREEIEKLKEKVK